MATIKPSDVVRIADMARLHLDEAELQVIGAEMEKVLDFVTMMAEVDTDGIVPMTHPAHRQRDELRADEPRPSLAKEEVLQNAPQVQDGYFRVPRIVEE